MALTPFVLVFFISVAWALSCSVDNTGAGTPDYTDLSAAVAGCRGPFPDLDVTLQVRGTFSLSGLLVPTHITLLSFQSITGASNDFIVTDVGMILDVTEIARQPAIQFINVTFSLGNSSNPLFVTSLGNQNLTISGCNIANSSASPLITQEVCKNDMVLLTFTGNTIAGMSGRLLNATGLSGWLFTDNKCAACGYNLTAGDSLVYLKQSDVASFPRIFNFNDLYRKFNCRAQPRCLYSMEGNGFYVRCNKGNVECYDVVRTEQRGNCPIINITLIDPVTNATELVLDHDPSCRVYGPCICTEITYVNASVANSQITLAGGNIVYGGNIVKTILPCRPRITDPFGKKAYLYQDIFFGGSRYVNNGDDDKNFNDDFKDKASSSQVGDGYTITLFKNSNYGGQSINITGFNTDFKTIDFNDKATSIKWVPVPWTSSDVPLWNSSNVLPLPDELDQDYGYYQALWRQPATQVYLSARNLLLGADYPSSYSSFVKPLLTFVNGSMFFMYFDAGIIYPLTCPNIGCQNTPGGDDLPCDYLIYPGNATNVVNDTAATLEATPGFGTADSSVDNDYVYPFPATPFDMENYLDAHCLDGDTFCCTTPDNATPNFPAYAIGCSSSPNASIPVVYPNGTLVGNLTQIPDNVFHCTYLVNCTYDKPNNQLDGCKQFRCGMTPCRLNTTYLPGDDCYDALNIGTDQECNGTNTAATYKLCQFLESDCLQYYYNGYLKNGFTFASDLAQNPTDAVVPTICEFSIDSCAAAIAASGQTVFRDSLCYCSSCNISFAADVGCNLTAAVGSPLPTKDAHCYSAVLVATASTTTLADCINNVAPDTGCQTAQIACDWTTLPPYDGVVHGERCFAAVQTFYSSTVNPTNCMNLLFPTADVGCLQARLACAVERLTRPPNLPCLHASVNGGTPTPAPTSIDFAPPSTYPPTTTTAPGALDHCFNLSVTSPNASCTAARATCYVYFPQPYMYPNPSCFYAQYTAVPSTVPLYQCMDLTFSPTDAACDAARAACSDRLCFDLFGLGANNAYEDCSNPYATDDTVSSFCLWKRYNCESYYNPSTAELLAGNCFASDPTCVGTVIPGQCELDSGACASNADTRCTCSADTGVYLTAPDVLVTQVEDIIYGRPDLGIPYIAPMVDGNQFPVFEPSGDPVRLPMPLRFEDDFGTCQTQLWSACDCPPQAFAHSLVPYQGCEIDPANGYCNTTTYSYDLTGFEWNNDTFLNNSYLTWPLSDYPATSLSAQIGLPGLYCSATTKRLKCDCSFSFLVNLIDPAPQNTSGIHFDNLHLNDSDLQIVDNSACDYHWGLRQDQSDPTLIRQKMFPVPDFFDSYSAMRDLWRNPNDYILGVIPFVQEPYSYDPRICIDGCTQDKWGGIADGMTESDADYIIDGGVNIKSPEYGITIFRSFYHIRTSARGSPKLIYVRDWGHAYNEPAAFPCPPTDSGCDQDQQQEDLDLTFSDEQADWWFFSNDSPTVIVSNFMIETPKVRSMTFQGINFRHPGDSRVPMLKLVKSKGVPILTALRFLNCDFEGGGVSSAGILSVYGEITELVFSHCSIENWNVFALYADRVKNFIFVGNTVSNCIGNCIHARITQVYSIRDNTFIDSRGGGGKIKGAATVTVTGVADLLDMQARLAALFGSDQSFARMCYYEQLTFTPPYAPGSLPFNTSDPNTAWQYRCNVWNNVHITNVLDNDFDDTFIEVWEGAYNESIFIGNSVLKAQYGITLYGTDLDPTPEELDLLARQNPRSRPSKYRSPDATPGADFKGIAQNSWVERVFGFEPRARDDWQCNWPCNLDIQEAFAEGNISCIINNEYSPRTMERSTPFNVIRLQRGWAYGYAEFRNGSDAVQFCTDFRTYGFPPVAAPEIYFTTWGGSEFIRDNISLVQNVRLYGNPAGAFKAGVPVIMPGDNFTTFLDQGVLRPTPCSLANGVRPCVRAKGNTIATLLARFDDLCWQVLDSTLGLDLWGTGEPAPVSFESYRCEYDGRNLIPLNNIFAVLVYCGTIFPANDQTAPENTDELPLPTSCRIYFHDNIIANFTSFDASVVSTTARGLVRRVQLTDYPYSSGAAFLAINTLNADTYAELINNTFINIDRTAVTVRGFINATIVGNIGYNISGRSVGNTAAVFLEANNHYSTVPDVSNDNAAPPTPLWIFNNNTFSQEKTILTPFGANTAFPVMLPGAYFRAFSANTTLCIFGNNFQSYPVGFRFTDFNLTVLTSCPAPGQVVGFPDAQRFLRFVAENNGCLNPDVNGTVYDLEVSFAGTALEATRDAVFCNFCCPPGPPTACWYDSSIPGCN